MDINISDNFIQHIIDTNGSVEEIFHSVFRKGEIFLEDTQISAITELLQNKKSILSFEMGLGKTAILMALASLLLPKAIEENKLIIISVPSANLSSFKTLVEKQMYFRERIQIINGEKKNVDAFFTKFDGNKTNLLICQHSCWSQSPTFNYRIFNRRHKILAAFYDEAIEKYSIGYQHFISICENVAEYVVMATASLNGSTGSFKANDDSLLVPAYNLVKAIGLAKELSYRNFLKMFTTTNWVKQNIHYNVLQDELTKFIGKNLVNLSRQHLGIGSEFDLVEFIRANPTDNQLSLISSTSESKKRILYGELGGINFTPQEVPVLGKLIELLFRLPKETNKIIYCNHIESTINLRNILKTLGYNVLVINGVETPSPQDKQRVANLFNDTSGTVLITNITKGINLGSGYNIITLSIPPDLPQFIARAIRGFKKGNIALHILYYPTHEKDRLVSCLKAVSMNDSMLDRGYEKLLEGLNNEINAI